MKKTMRFFKNLSMQEQIIFSLSSLIILAFVVMNVVSYTYTRYVLTRTVTANTFNSLKQFSQMLEEKFYTIHLFTNLMSENNALKDIFRTPNSEKTAQTLYEERELIHRIYDDFRYYNPDMSGMMALGHTGDLYRFGKTYEVDISSYRSTDWYQNALKKSGSIAWSGKRKSPYSEYGEDIYLIYLSRELIDSRDNKSLGVFYLEITEKQIHNMLVKAKYDESESLYIVTGGGELISHTDHGMLNGAMPKDIAADISKMTEKQGSFLSGENSQNILNVYFTLPITGWRIVYTVPFNHLITRLGIVNTINLWVSFIGLVVIILMSFLILRRIITPLRRFSRSITQLSRTGAAALPGTKNEIGYLSDVFEDMTGQIQQLLCQVRTEEQGKNTAQLQALQAQINPHFLYNTLEAVRMVCEINNNLDAAKMLNLLGRLLRYGLSQTGSSVTLADELRQIELYVQLMKYRHQNTFDVEYDIADGTKGTLLPKTILQPIVENSVFHAFSDLDRPGLLLIRTKRTEKLVEIEIKDNGCGFVCEANDIVSSGQEIADTPHFGIGLKNIHNRIRLVYGEAYGLSVSSTPGEGTSVKILVPFQTGGERV